MFCNNKRNSNNFMMNNYCSFCVRNIKFIGVVALRNSLFVIYYRVLL